MTRLMVLLRGQPSVAAFCLATSAAWAGTTLNVAASTNVYAHGFLVYDTLFAPDENLGIHPQMAGDEAASADKPSHTLTLRPSLTFHDGCPVATRDVIASLRRWTMLGQRAQFYAWRSTISGLVHSPSLVPVFWGIEKRQ